MSRLHDMGGRFGDGPVAPDFGQEPVFKEEWHGRALALTVASGFLRQWNLDEGRHARECLAPMDYTAFSYYEKWLAGLTDILVAKGLVTPEELSTGQAALDVSDVAQHKLTQESVAESLARGGPSERQTDETPKFALGEQVTTISAGNRSVAGGHTRLPSYAASCSGRIVTVHPPHVFPDANAHGYGEAAETLYTVAFKAGDLWQHPENPTDEVMLDLWQSYLKTP